MFLTVLCGSRRFLPQLLFFYHIFWFWEESTRRIRAILWILRNFVPFNHFVYYLVVVLLEL